MPYSRIPEIAALQGSGSLLRIPAETDVPVTPRVLRIIDTEPFRRLSRISQLGLVSLVYPGAVHTRQEHSLGVYRNALLYLSRLASDSVFTASIDDRQASIFILAALLHDIGHWPFCHAIEDLQLPEIARHEKLARGLLTDSELADCIRQDWSCEPEEVADLLAPGETAAPNRLLASMLSGPIDIDKMDYLDRDSLHAGVPYGRNFDRQRLIRCLCVGPLGDRLAIQDKARTAAEMMVFARYVMFSEVYWHHAVRSATAMLQRSVYELQSQSDFLIPMQHQTEGTMIDSLRTVSHGTCCHAMIDGLFGTHRKLYKRAAQYHVMQQPELHLALARRPYQQLVFIGNRLSELLSQRMGQLVKPTDVLIDAPPVKLEVQFDLAMKSADGTFHALGDISPVVKTLATKQFDDTVKRVRIFIAPHLIDSAASHDISELVQIAISETTGT